MSGGMENVPHTRAARDREHVVGGGVPVRPATARRAPAPVGRAATDAAHGIAPARLQRGDVVPRVAELEQDQLRVLAVLGRAPQLGACAVELHRHRRAAGTPARRRRRPRRCSRWRSPAGRRAAPRPPAPAPTARRASASSSFHSTNVRDANSAVRISTHSSACSLRACEVDEPRIVDQLGATDEPAEVGPVAVGLEEHERDVAVVLRASRRRRAGSRSRSRSSTSRAAARPATPRGRRTTASTSRWRAATRRRPCPCPVRVRSSSAAAMPNASAIAPLRSPIAPR